MRKHLLMLILCTMPWWLHSTSEAQAAKPESQELAATQPPAITIYNQNFAVVRETLGMNLASGVNNVWFGGMSAKVEPDSVMLRDPSGARQLQAWEQNYRNDPVTQELLLSLFEGKSIDFQVQRGEHVEIIHGKVIRSGFVPRLTYNDPYFQGATQPIIEVDGKLIFGLPGQPIFPSLVGDTILKPSMNWLVQTDKPGKFDAELSYVTGGMTWEADYNLVAPEKGDVIDIVGWVTINNNSGTVFKDARLKLLAGDVNKIETNQRVLRGAIMAKEATMDAMAPPVTEKSFDEYHLYTLQRPTTLHNMETKQVEFVAATGVKSTRFYLYDGASIGQFAYYSPEQVRQDPGYGTQSNPKVWVMQEFENTEANHLGVPLPRGKMRFYRRDTDGHLEFTGENVIDHTPKNETIRVYTGNAFDITGERKRTDYHVSSTNRSVDESFEIKVRNRKKEPVQVRVLEHLYRWSNWQIVTHSDEYKKLDSRTIEYRVTIPPDGEKVITYTAHYWW